MTSETRTAGTRPRYLWWGLASAAPLYAVLWLLILSAHHFSGAGGDVSRPGGGISPPAVWMTVIFVLPALAGAAVAVTGIRRAARDAGWGSPLRRAFTAGGVIMAVVLAVGVVEAAGLVLWASADPNRGEYCMGYSCEDRALSAFLVITLRAVYVGFVGLVAVTAASTSSYAVQMAELEARDRLADG